jgi:hypothetical protein
MRRREFCRSQRSEHLPAGSSRRPSITVVAAIQTPVFPRCMNLYYTRDQGSPHFGNNQNQ